MAMGSTGTVNITPEMMRNALSAIEEYRTTINGIHTKLNGTFAELYPGNFSGSAAEGFSSFNTNKIQPLIGAEGEGVVKVLDALKEICEGILAAIPDTDGLDDQLGSENSK
jgi:uncharacterized protein YukE